jgi:hypothetical protein
MSLKPTLPTVEYLMIAGMGEKNLYLRHRCKTSVIEITDIL